jgi:hypothetical protein
MPGTAAVVNLAPPETPRHWRVALSAVGGAVLGAAPHVLHHAGLSPAEHQTPPR